MIKVTYLTNNSIVSGVGRSQVFEYLRRLPAYGIAVDVVSFEPAPPPKEEARILEKAEIAWSPLPFGERGPIPGLDRGRRLRRALSGSQSDLVHARADVPGYARLGDGRPWIWDIRSFWVEQRAAMNRLPAWLASSSVPMRLRRLVASRADGLVLLSQRAHDQLGGDRQRLTPNVAVISTCVDLERFRPGFRELAGRHNLTAAYSGSVNAYYDFGLMATFVQRLEQVISASRSVELAFWSPHRMPDVFATIPSRAEVLDWDAIPAATASADIGLAVCHADAGISLAAASPTKIAEFLSSGVPVVVNPGLGDFDELLPRYGAGVILRRGYEREAVEAVVELVHDPLTSDRCRQLARDHFSLERAVERLAGLYHTALNRH